MNRVKLVAIALIAGFGSLVQNAYSAPTAQLPENFTRPSAGGGGSNLSNPAPPSTSNSSCDFYNLVVNPQGDSLEEYTRENAAKFEGRAVLSGPASEVSCIADAISWCSQYQPVATFETGIYDGRMHSYWGSDNDRSKFEGDDCIGNYLASAGKIRGQRVCYDWVGCGMLVDAGTYLFDRNCNLVRNPSSSEQCSIDYTFWWSPISLLWEDGVEIDDQLAVVEFPLNIGASKQWYSWKASAKSPLLVYDPEHQGQVTSPTQLFGNWTFGGQRTAHAGGQREMLPRPWKDGYEALATLDVDRNGELSGQELAPLGVWFDKNQDGKSQAGEVKSAKSADIRRIFVTPNRRDPVTQEMSADRGFERITKEGKSFIGKSIDWLGEAFDNPLEAVALMQARTGLRSPEAGHGRETGRDSNLVLSKSVKLTDSLTGIWRWQTENADLASYRTSGVLSLKDDGHRIFGQAYVEVPLKSRRGRVSRIVKRNEIQGRRRISADGKITVRLTLKDHGDMKNVSQATMSADGLEMRGQTTAFVKVKGRTKVVPVKYSWIAKRAL